MGAGGAGHRPLHKAIEQLGSDKMDVRLGGIYALGRIAVDSERDHPTVVEVLGAFVRRRTDFRYLYDQAGQPGSEGASWEERQAIATRT